VPVFRVVPQVSGLLVALLRLMTPPRDLQGESRGGGPETTPGPHRGSVLEPGHEIRKAPNTAMPSGNEGAHLYRLRLLRIWT
jgi:hypothetical protein